MVAEEENQEFLDRFYWEHGPCCAGCDWWGGVNSLVGVCRKSAPTTGLDRAEMLGMVASSLRIGSGHAFTRREHRCDDFKDEFDWSSLPIGYQKRVAGRIFKPNPATPPASS